MKEWIEAVLKKENLEEAAQELEKRFQQEAQEKAALLEELDREKANREEERKRLALSFALTQEEAEGIDYLLMKRGTEGITLDEQGRLLNREAVIGELKEQYRPFFPPPLWGKEPEQKAVSAPQKRPEEMTYSELIQPTAGAGAGFAPNV